MEYDKSKFKIWTWKHPVVLHWILNPGLAINELIFGQRIPRVILSEKDSTKSLPERTIIPCPHCGTFHSGIKWSRQNNASKNWFGLYCDNCGKTIPCLRNFTSFILLALTSPIWLWFKDKMRENWLQRQPERYKNLNLEDIQNPFQGRGWIIHGLYFGLFMAVFTAFIFPFIKGENLTIRNILFEIAVWTIGGLIFGYLMKLFFGNTKIKKHSS